MSTRLKRTVKIIGALAEAIPPDKLEEVVDSVKDDVLLPLGMDSSAEEVRDAAVAGLIISLCMISVVNRKTEGETVI